jgi:hypothetical protein
MSQLRLIHEAVRSIHDDEQKKRRKTRGPLKIPSELMAVHEFVKYFNDVVHPEIQREEVMKKRTRSARGVL